LKAGSPSSFQPTIENPPVNIEGIFSEKSSKDCAEVREMSSGVESLQQTYGSQHGEAFSFCELPSPVIVQKNDIRTALFRQQNRAQLSRPKGMLFAEDREGFRIAELSTFYPIGASNLCGSRQAFSSDHHFFVDFRRNDQPRKQSV
jgi:hypothetical protein